MLLLPLIVQTVMFTSSLKAPLVHIPMNSFLRNKMPEAETASGITKILLWAIPYAVMVIKKYTKKAIAATHMRGRTFLRLPVAADTIT